MKRKREEEAATQQAPSVDDTRLEHIADSTQHQVAEVQRDEEVGRRLSPPKRGQVAVVAGVVKSLEEPSAALGESKELLRDGKTEEGAVAELDENPRTIVVILMTVVRAKITIMSILLLLMLMLIHVVAC